MYLPREIVEKTLGDAGHPSRARLLGRTWRDLRTRQELKEELERPIELEDILFWSRKTGRDFVICGHGVPRYRQIMNQAEGISPSGMADYYFHQGRFILTGNAADETFIELYEYANDTYKRRYIVREKKTSRLESLSAVFDELFYPLEEISSKNLIGVEYEDGYTLNFEHGDPIIEEIIDYEYSEERTPLLFAWSEDKTIKVQGVAETPYGVLFYGYSSLRKELYLEKEVAEYILQGRVAYSLDAEEAVSKYLLPVTEREQFERLLALREDPRPDFDSEDKWK